MTIFFWRRHTLLCIMFPTFWYFSHLAPKYARVIQSYSYIHIKNSAKLCKELKIFPLLIKAELFTCTTCYHLGYSTMSPSNTNRFIFIYNETGIGIDHISIIVIILWEWYDFLKHQNITSIFTHNHQIIGRCKSWSNFRISVFRRFKLKDAHNDCK